MTETYSLVALDAEAPEWSNIFLKLSGPITSDPEVSENLYISAISGFICCTLSGSCLSWITQVNTYIALMNKKNR